MLKRLVNQLPCVIGFSGEVDINNLKKNLSKKKKKLLVQYQQGLQGLTEVGSIKHF